MDEQEMMFDKNKFLIECIESALLHASMLKTVIPSPATDKLESLLKTIKEEYPPNFKSFILGQLHSNKWEPLYLQLWGNGTYKISMEKVEEVPPKANKKWYQFG